MHDNTNAIDYLETEGPVTRKSFVIALFSTVTVTKNGHGSDSDREADEDVVLVALLLPLKVLRKAALSTS